MIKIVSLSIIFAIIIIYLKSQNSELAMPTTVCAGIIIIGFVINELSLVFSFINELIEVSGLDKEFYTILFKITAIGYIVEFGASTISDFGLNNLADKLIFAGKIIIFSVSLPIIYAVFNLFTGLLQ